MNRYKDSHSCVVRNSSINSCFDNYQIPFLVHDYIRSVEKGDELVDRLANENDEMVC